ncbi:MAG: tRNA (adenosine(37)-N6)-threonylcarbamoyltransferase complex dimerization subunit type 1 TsaB [Bacteroidales bacterium]
MPVILNIETATEICSVSLSQDDRVIALKETDKEKSHASVLSVFIHDLLKENGLEGKSPDAIAVSMGPGSYTGLRIGVSVAKGLCYGFDIPLIPVPTLEAMSLALIEKLKSEKADIPGNALFSPMLDARRMEVYMALFTAENKIVKDTTAQIITENTFDQLLSKHSIYFFGSGSGKVSELISHENAFFISEFTPSSADLAPVAYAKYKAGEFADLAYFEPFYLKDFITTKPGKKIVPLPGKK